MSSLPFPSAGLAPRQILRTIAIGSGVIGALMVTIAITAAYFLLRYGQDSLFYQIGNLELATGEEYVHAIATVHALPTMLVISVIGALLFSWIAYGLWHCRALARTLGIGAYTALTAFCVLRVVQDVFVIYAFPDLRGFPLHGLYAALLAGTVFGVMAGQLVREDLRSLFTGSPAR